MEATMTQRPCQRSHDGEDRERRRHRHFPAILETRGQAAGRHRDMPRREFARRAVPVAGRAVRDGGPCALRPRPARARQVGRRALLRRGHLRIRRRRRVRHQPRKVTLPGIAGLPARPQRRRRRVLLLRTRPAGGNCRTHLRELRVQGAGAGCRPRGDQGAERHHAASSRSCGSRTRISRATRSPCGS